MPGIKFNQLTGEIEMTGSESYIDANFEKIRDLLIEGMGVEKQRVSMETQETHEAVKPAIPEFSQEVKVTRPPLRKYIRKVGLPGKERIVVEVAKQKPTDISIESLKEKFGLPASKIGGIIRETEKLGKIRRALDGSYVWS